MLKSIILSALMMVGILSIGVPIRGRESKCMIVFSVGQSQTVKIDTQLPQIPGALNDEYYEINIVNTETNEIITQKQFKGNFKKQLHLALNVIYEICFRVQSNRQFGQVIIQYTANNLFNFDHKEIKVPQNIMKSGDFKISYQKAQKLKAVTENFKDLQTARKESQSSTFIQTIGLNKWLMYISVAQIAIIIVTALYQFVTLRQFLSSKQLI